MTAIATAPPIVSTPVRRWWSVIKMHVANPWTTLIVPWFITAAVFGVNASIWAIVIQAAGGRENLEVGAFTYNGGISWIAIFMMVMAIQAMSLTFRFAIGFSATRRDYYIGTAIYFVLLSLKYVTGIVILAAIERATDGWGIGAAFFAPWGFRELPLATVWFVYLMVMLMFIFLGAAVATTWVRWKQYGLYGFFLVLAVVGVGAGWSITTAGAWPEVAEFFSSTSAIELALWTLPLTLVSASVGYLLLRRATPRE